MIQGREQVEMVFVPPFGRCTVVLDEHAVSALPENALVEQSLVSSHTRVQARSTHSRSATAQFGSVSGQEHS